MRPENAGRRNFFYIILGLTILGLAIEVVGKLGGFLAQIVILTLVPVLIVSGILMLMGELPSKKQ